MNKTFTTRIHWHISTIIKQTDTLIWNLEYAFYLSCMHLARKIKSSAPDHLQQPLSELCVTSICCQHLIGESNVHTSQRYPINIFFCPSDTVCIYKSCEAPLNIRCGKGAIIFQEKFSLGKKISVKGTASVRTASKTTGYSLSSIYKTGLCCQRKLSPRVSL